MASADYDHDVFINCPFDKPYRDLLYALVFAVHDCGFRARCALEVDDAGLVRIDNIIGLIRECRFGIHDISRTELDEDNGLPRFNMPLELGLFLGAMKYGHGRQRQKHSLILDRERYRYQKFISDIAGQDIKAHEDKSEVVIRHVRNWLNNSPVDAGVTKPGAKKMHERYARFMEELPTLCKRFHLDVEGLTFIDFRTLLVEWLVYNEW